MSFSLIISRLVLFHIHFTQEMNTLFLDIIVTICLWQCEISIKDRVTFEQMSKKMSFQIFPHPLIAAHAIRGCDTKASYFGTEKGTIV